MTALRLQKIREALLSGEVLTYKVTVDEAVELGAVQKQMVQNSKRTFSVVETIDYMLKPTQTKMEI